MTLQNKYENLALDSTSQSILNAVITHVEKYTIGEPQYSFGNTSIAPLASSDIISFMTTKAEKLAFVYVSGYGDGDFTLKINTNIVWVGSINRNNASIHIQIPLNINTGDTVSLSVLCNGIGTSTYNATIIHG